MKMVEAYRSFDAIDANLVCSMLCAAGLRAAVQNEIATLSLEGYSVASGGIRVMVPENEYDAARELIEHEGRGD